MADVSATSQQERTDEQQHGREAGRAIRGGARAARAGMQSMGDTMREGIEATGRTASAGMQRMGGEIERATHGMADEAERIGSELAAETGDMLEEMRRLAVLPQVAAKGLEAAQEASNAWWRSAIEANLQVLNEVSQTTNPLLFLQAQQRILRQVVHGMREQGTAMMRASERLVRETLGPLQDRERAWVGEVMSRDVRLARPDQTVEEAARLMGEADTGALPVGENDRLVGMITDRDIACRAVAAGRSAARTKVADAMSKGITYCFDDQDVKEAAQLMEKKQIHRLPVLNREKRMVGLLSIGDLALHAPHELTGEVIEAVSQHTA